MDKRWRLFEGADCPYCGDDVEVLTDCSPGLVWDGDKARCVSCYCPGCMIVDEGADARVSWHDPEPGCECEWCKGHPA